MKNLTDEINSTLPRTRPESIINDVYASLQKGRILTSLDAVESSHTVNLPKYVSLLKSKYGIPVCDRWIQLDNHKRIKQFFLNPEDRFRSKSN